MTPADRLAHRRVDLRVVAEDLADIGRCSGVDVAHRALLADMASRLRAEARRLDRLQKGIAGVGEAAEGRRPPLAG